VKKLHELLSIEPDLRTEALKISGEVRETIADSSRVHGMIRTFHPIVDDEDPMPDERVEMLTTVSDELDRFNTAMGKFIDSAVSKEMTNTVASAELQLAGEIYKLPATALLNLENRLGEIRKVYAAIPTLDPAEVWNYDEDLEVYVADKRMAYKTRKVPKTHVSVEATKEHPAQVEIYHEDIRVGERETVVHSGALTLSRKRVLLGRIDQLMKDVKQARQRANDIEVDEVKIAGTIFDVINRE
jgi:hypothetical protein